MVALQRANQRARVEEGLYLFHEAAYKKKTIAVHMDRIALRRGFKDKNVFLIFHSSKMQQKKRICTSKEK